MSQGAQSQISALRQQRPVRTAATAASLLALAAVVLMLTLGVTGEKAAETISLPAHPALRTDGGPDESGVAAGLGSRSAPLPDESRIAASVSRPGRVATSAATATATQVYTPARPHPSNTDPSAAARLSVTHNGAR